MFKLLYFIHALNVSWIRRYRHKESKWTPLLKLAYPYSHKFVKFGVLFIKDKLQTSEDNFWYDTF